MLINRRKLLWLIATLAKGASSSYEKTRQALANRKIFIVPYSHIDWAYTHSRQWQADRAALVISEALDLLKRYPEYRFFIDTWDEETEPFVTRRPERVPELRAAIESGQLAVCGGTVCNSHPVLMEPEALIRDMVMGRRYFRRLAPKVNLDVMVHYDVMPGPSQMPQLLAKAGYRGYRFWRPSEALDAEGKPKSFVWRGLDGSTVLVSRGPYGGLRSPASLKDDFHSNWNEAMLNFSEKEIGDLKLQPAQALWIPMGSDDVRPLRASLYGDAAAEKPMPLVEFIEEWNRRESTPLHFATPQEYFHELEKNKSALPVVEGVLDQTQWTHWYGRDGRRSLHVPRAVANDELVASERFASCAAALGEPYPDQELTRAWRDLFSFSSHAQSNLYKEDFQAQTELAGDTVYRAREVGTRAMSAIASRVKTGSKGMPILLFNELPWERTEVVRIWAQVQELGTRNIVIHDGRGNVAPHQAIDLNEVHGGSREIFKEANLLVRVTAPALGYTTLYVEPASGAIDVPALRSGVESLHTDFADVTFSSEGVRSLVHKASSDEYKGFGNLLFREIGGSDFGPVKQTVRVRDGRLLGITEGPLRSSFTFEGAIGRDKVRVTGHLYPHAHRVSFETEIESYGSRGHYLTTTGLPRPGKLFADVHFGVEERDPSKVVYAGVERGLKGVFYGSHWVDSSSEAHGVAIVGAVGEKGYLSLPEEPLLGHFLLRTVLPTTTGWERFVTHAREGTGVHAFEYHYLLHQGDWRGSGVARRAMEAQYPLRPVFPNSVRKPAERTLPDEKSFVRVGPETVMLSALYRDQGRYMLRVNECSGQAGRAEVELPFHPTSARITDFHGASIRKDAQVSGATVRFDIAPWEIVTLSIL